MSTNFQGAWERQFASLNRRLRESEAQSAAAAEALIAACSAERRSSRRADLEREVERLRHERERVERERTMGESVISEAEIECHLQRIEQQIHEVLEERDRWYRESLEGHRRRKDDFRFLRRLKEENERLTAELLRCAATICQNRRATEDPRLRRVWQMLRLSGT